MIANFPVFTKLNIEHKEEVQDLTSKFEPYSDFNFTSLFCWNTDGSTEVSKLNNNLVIRLPDYLSGDPIYSMLGSTAIDDSVSSLIRSVEAIHLVPQSVVSLIQDKSPFVIEPDQDSFDYVYNIGELADLAGQKFKKKRNKVNRFEKTMVNSLRVNLVRSLDSVHADQLKRLCHKWSRQTRREEGDFSAERKAVIRMLDNFKELKILLIEVWVDNELMAFSANEIISNNYAICHFEKALRTAEDNIYTFMTCQSAKILRDLGLKYINWEQDLGLEGLRQSKSSFHPDFYLKKYKLSLV